MEVQVGEHVHPCPTDGWMVRQAAMGLAQPSTAEGVPVSPALGFGVSGLAYA